MQGRDPAVVGPLGHEVAQVDDEGVGQVRHVEPAAVRRLDLQAAFGGIRLDDRRAAVVGVRAGAQRPGRGGSCCGG